MGKILTTLVALQLAAIPLGLSKLPRELRLSHSPYHPVIPIICSPVAARKDPQRTEYRDAVDNVDRARESARDLPQSQRVETLLSFFKKENKNIPQSRDDSPYSHV